MDRNLEVILVLIYAIPSIFVYMAIICLLVKKFNKKPFSSSFYKLFLVNGTLDITYWILLYFESRVSNATWFYWFYRMLPANGFVPTILIWLNYYIFYAQITTYFFITFNRFTAVLWPTLNQKIWEKLFPISIGIIFLISFPFTWHILAAGGYCMPRDPPTLGYRLDVYRTFNIPSPLFDIIFTFGAGLSGLFMNSCMVVCLYIRKKSSTSGKFISDPKDTEAKLFLFSLLTGLSFSMSFVLKVIFVLNPNMPDEMFVVILNVQSYAWDLFMLTPPWFILFLSSLIRNEFKKILGFSTSQIIVVTPRTVS